MNIYIIGIGLIGGSMALDLKSHFKEATFFGIDADQDHLELAFKVKIIDKKADTICRQEHAHSKNGGTL